jgi:hypothetical protein
MNSRFVTDCASKAVGLVLDDPARSDAERVRAAYRCVLGRPPEAAEADDALKLLADLSGSERDRWAALVQALMASAEFRYVR